MQIESGNTNWSQLLKSALLCMNSTIKRSHGDTPFRLMWGRDSRYEELVPSINHVSVSAEEDVDMEEAIFALYNTVLPDSESDLYSLPPEPQQECIASLDTFRKTTCELAGGNIKTEQLRQKRQYDKKVTQIRFVMVFY